MLSKNNLFKRIVAVCVLALFSYSIPSRAHTEAIGYVNEGPGAVDVWFGTYHSPAELPITEGHALLTLPGGGTLSVPFNLTSSTTPVGLVNGVNLVINSGFTLGTLEAWEGASFTGLTQSGTYSVDFDPLFPLLSSKWANALGGAITFTIAIIPLALPDGGLTVNQQGVLGPINQGLSGANASPAFTTLSTALMAIGSNPADLGAALDQLSPLKFGNFTSATAFNNASFETQSMDSYLAEQREGAKGTFTGGNGNIDASGLTLNDPNYDPNLAMVHSRLLSWNPAPVGAISDSLDSVLGGVDMKEIKPMAEPPSDPWNFFVRGNVILAQGLSQADQSHFNDNTESVVVGADYRLTPNFLVGLSAGYAHTDVTLDNDNSSATVDSYSPGIYASYADKGWYANFMGDYLHNAYTQDRVIGFLGQTASSAPEGDEGLVDLDGGYDFHHGAWTYGPLAGLQYTHLTVNGYNETGSVADLSVNEQQSDSLRSRLGGNVSYAFSHYGIHFTPHLEASWQHEFLDQSRGITSQFNEFGGGSFAVRTQNASRDSALVDAGITAEVNRTVTLFADYMVQAGQDNYFGQSVQGGVKVGF